MDDQVEQFGHPFLVIWLLSAAIDGWYFFESTILIILEPEIQFSEKNHLYAAYFYSSLPFPPWAMQSFCPK